MSEIKYQCALCNEPIEGEKTDFDVFEKPKEFPLGYVATGFCCKNCSAVVCGSPKKHFGMNSLRLSVFKGWKKIDCPICGEKFFPGRHIIKKVKDVPQRATPIDPQIKKRIDRAYDYLRAEDLMRNSMKRDIIRSTIDEFGDEVFDEVLRRIEKNPGFDIRRQLENILAIGRLVGAIDTDLEIPNVDIYDVVKVEESLMGLSSAKNYQIRKDAWRMLIFLSAKTGSRDLIPQIIERMLDLNEVNYVRAEIAGALGVIQDDERVVDGLIKALSDRGERSIEEAMVSISDLFRSLPSTAELAAESLREIGDPKGLRVLADLKNRGIKLSVKGGY